jgi:excisionase family DNA binding protein
MARSRKPNRQCVKIHRNYTVEETARTLGVAKGTVRRWIKGGLPALTDRKPTLILGSDLTQYLSARGAPRQTCERHECYCVKCRAPRKPAGDMAEYVPLTPTVGNLRAMCPTCGTLIHKRMRLDALEPISRILDLTFAQAVPRITDLSRTRSAGMPT